MPLRIANVAFLNTRPLVAGLADDPGVDLVADLPSRLGALLDEDRADVAMLPVVEHLRGVGACLVPGAAIAARGPVASVKLFHRGDAAGLDRVVVDRGSRTSAALLRVLLDERHGVRPDFVEVAPDPRDPLAGADGALVIGDRCFAVEGALRRSGRLGRDLSAMDLGEAWHAMTGLPFVFAAWVVGEGFARRAGDDGLRTLTAMLQRARNAGLATLDAIADRAAAEGHVGPGGEPSAAALRRYYRDNLDFDLGDEELAGLARFRDLAAARGLCPADRPLRLAPGP